MSVRSLNGLSSVFVNTIQAGDAISVSSSGSSISTINVDISKQSANTTIADTDLFLLEDNSGNIRKITGSNMKSEIDTNFWSFSSPSLYPINTTDNIILGGTSNTNSRKLLINGTLEATGNSYLNTISTGTWNGDRLGKSYVPTDIVYDADLLTAENFGTALSRTDPDTLNVGCGGNTSGVGTTTNIDAYTINIGKLVASGGGNSGSVGANNITLQATQYYSGNPTINITAQSASGVVDTGAEVNITSKKNGSGSEVANITMVADTEIIMNTGLKINSSGAITAVGSKITNGLIDTGIGDNKIVEIDSSTVADNDYAKFTANGLEGMSYSEVASDIGSSITTVGTIGTGVWNGTRLGKDYIPTDTVYDADIASFITASSTDTLTNKTMGDFTTFNEGLGIKFNSFSGVSGFLRLYDNDATNFMDIHIEGHSLSSNISVFLPKGVDNTILVGKDTTDTLTNKTLTGGSNSIVSFSGNSGSVITTPSINGTLAVVSQIHTEHSYNTPLTINSGSVSLGGLNGFGSANQVLTTNGSDGIVYQTLTEGTNISIVNTGSTITISSSQDYWTRGSSITTVDIKPTSNVDEIDFLDTILYGNQTTYFGSSYGSIKEIYAEQIKCAFTYQQVLALYDDAAGTNTTTITATSTGIKINRDRIISNDNNECYIDFDNTIFTSTFHRTDMVKLRIAKNTSYSAGTENGYIELIENGTTSNTTRIYFNNAGSAYIFYDGTNLIHTPSFAPSDRRVKKNETLADTNLLATSFDNINIYKYQYEEQYAIDKGTDPNKFVYGYIAQEVKENTEINSQFSSTGNGESIYPNDKVDYQGEKLKVNDLITINKTDMNIILWAKCKEQQKQIDTLTDLVNTMKTTIDKLNSSTSFKDFKSK